MKRRRPALVALACALAAIGGAVSASGQEQNMTHQEKRVFGEVVRGCRLSISAPEFLDAGGRVPLSVVVRNESTGPVVMLTTFDQSYRLRVRLPDGPEVPLTRHGAARQRHPEVDSMNATRIEPGEDVEGTIALHRFVDLSESGRYSVEVQRTLLGSPSGEPFDVTSNAIVILLREP